jgi:PAS domain S-box-containing protein
MEITSEKMILLIEDEAIIALAEAQTIQKFGYHTIHELTGEKAVARVREAPGAIDLILMDIDLGKGIDGPEAARQILKIRNIPIVFLTSHAEEEYVDRVREITRYGYVIKSAGHSVLKASIEMAFELFRAHESLKYELHERQRLEDNLRASEARYRTLAENLPDIVYRIHLAADRRIEFFNDRVRTITGYDASELGTDPINALAPHLHPDDRPRIMADLEQAIKSNDFFETTYRFRHKNGAWRYLSERGHLIRDAAGRLQEIDGVIVDITSEKQAEADKEAALKALTESEFRLARGEKTAHVGNWKINLDTRTLVSSIGARLVYGVDSSVMSLGDVQKFPLPAYRPRLDKALADLIAQGTRYDLEFKIRRASDGQIRDIHSVADFDAENRVVYGVIQDITERKRIEITLQENEKRLNDIMLNMADWVWEVDEQGVYTFSSGKSLDFLGKSSAEVIGKKPFDFMAPDEVTRMGAIFAAIVAQKAPFKDLENWVIGKNGERACLLTSGVPIVDEKGNLRGYRGVDRDITLRKQAEEFTKNTMLFQQTLLDSIPAPVFYKNTACVYLGGNKAFEHYIGLAAEQFVGKTVFEIAPAHLADKYAQADLALLNHPGIQEYETDVIYADGTPHKVIFRKATFNNVAGQVAGLIGVMQDVTMLRLSETKIQNLLAEKELILKEVHHRIKNNINAIKAMLILQSYSLEDTRAIAALDAAQNRLQSMAILYDKLFQSDLSGQISVRQYLPDLVDEVIENFPSGIKINVSKEIDDFILDAKQLQPLGIIINELITNILKYAFAGREEGTIQVTASCQETHVVIAIEDDGVGFPDGISFEKSTGFGLKLVWMLVQQLAGTIQVTKGNGTRIVMELEK